MGTVVDSPQMDASGARVLDGRYELRDVIAVGGAGTVWRAADRRTGEPVAVKLLNSEAAQQPDVVDAFRREAQLLSELDHPGVVRACEFVDTGADLALVMDLVPGTDLRALLRTGGPLAPADAADVVGQLCAALAAVHEAGIVHGDVKPNNILVPSNRDSDRVRLVDFGVAHRIQVPAEPTHATPEYVAPEVVDGAPATPASDVYGVGLVLYETLAGRSAYRGGSMEDVLQRHARCEVVRLDGMPDGLWHLIDSCLALEAARRPRATRVANELAALAGSLTGLAPLRVPAHAATYRPRTVPAVPAVPRQIRPAGAEPEEKPVPATDDNEFASLDDLMAGKAKEHPEPASAEPWAAPQSAVPWLTPDAPVPPAPPTTPPSTTPPPTTPIPATGTAAPWEPPPSDRKQARNLVLAGAAAVVIAGVLVVGSWVAFGGSSSQHGSDADKHHAAHSAAASPAPTHRHRSPATSPSSAPSPTGTPTHSPNAAPPPGGDQDPTTAPPSDGNTAPGTAPSIGNPMPTMP